MPICSIFSGAATAEIGRTKVALCMILGFRKGKSRVCLKECVGKEEDSVGQDGERRVRVDRDAAIF